jgi:lipopolysaccharide export system protein LptA
MTSRDHNRLVHYEGNAVMWQGANRIQADSIDIDRRNGRLRASGSVVSQFVDKAKDEEEKKKAAAKSPVYTVIRAPLMEYFDAERVAHYSGGSKLNRPSLDVTAAEIRAWLKPEKPKTDPKTDPKTEKDKQPAATSGTAGGSGTDPKADDEEDDSGSLDRVFADGKVQIHQVSPIRERTGTGEHSEYYADDEKVIITGGNPLLVDTLRGQTRGRVLTWYAQDDRLLVDNTGSGPAVSRIVKKKK